METTPKQFDNFESVESAHSRESFANFLNIDQDVLEITQGRLAEARGHGRISVHPLFTEQCPGTTRYLMDSGDDLEVVQKNLREAFRRNVESVVRNPKSSPLFVYESASNIEPTSAIISDWTNIEPSVFGEAGILFMTTEEGTPALNTTTLKSAFENGNYNDREYADQIHEYQELVSAKLALRKSQKEERLKRFPLSEDTFWFAGKDAEREEYSKFILEQINQQNEMFPDDLHSAKTLRDLKEDFSVDLFRSLGLESALVSGAYMTATIDHKTKEHKLSTCAGGVAQLLRDNDISTDISKNVWPPKDRLPKDKIQLKQTGRKKF